MSQSRSLITIQLGILSLFLLRYGADALNSAKLQLRVYELAEALVRQIAEGLRLADRIEVQPPNLKLAGKVGTSLERYCDLLYSSRQKTPTVYSQIYLRNLEHILQNIDGAELIRRYQATERPTISSIFNRMLEILKAHYGRIRLSTYGMPRPNRSFCVEWLYKERHSPVATILSHAEITASGFNVPLARFCATHRVAVDIFPGDVRTDRFYSHRLESSRFAECVNIESPSDPEPTNLDPEMSLYTEYFYSRQHKRPIDERFRRRDHFEILLQRMELWWRRWRPADLRSPILYVVISTGIRRWTTTAGYAAHYDRRECSVGADYNRSGDRIFRCWVWQLCLTVVEVADAENPIDIRRHHAFQPLWYPTFDEY